VHTPHVSSLRVDSHGSPRLVDLRLLLPRSGCGLRHVVVHVHATVTFGCVTTHVAGFTFILRLRFVLILRCVSFYVRLRSFTLPFTYVHRLPRCSRWLTAFTYTRLLFLRTGYVHFARSFTFGLPARLFVYVRLLVYLVPIYVYVAVHARSFLVCLRRTFGSLAHAHAGCYVCSGYGCTFRLVRLRYHVYHGCSFTFAFTYSFTVHVVFALRLRYTTRWLRLGLRLSRLLVTVGLRTRYGCCLVVRFTVRVPICWFHTFTLWFTFTLVVVVAVVSYVAYVCQFAPRSHGLRSHTFRSFGLRVRLAHHGSFTHVHVAHVSYVPRCHIHHTARWSTLDAFVVTVHVYVCFVVCSFTYVVYVHVFVYVYRSFVGSSRSFDFLRLPFPVLLVHYVHGCYRFAPHVPHVCSWFICAVGFASLFTHCTTPHGFWFTAVAPRFSATTTARLFVRYVRLPGCLFHVVGLVTHCTTFVTLPFPVTFTFGLRLRSAFAFCSFDFGCTFYVWFYVYVRLDFTFGPPILGSVLTLYVVHRLVRLHVPVLTLPRSFVYDFVRYVWFRLISRTRSFRLRSVHTFYTLFTYRSLRFTPFDFVPAFVYAFTFL